MYGNTLVLKDELLVIYLVSNNFKWLKKRGASLEQLYIFSFTSELLCAIEKFKSLPPDEVAKLERFVYILRKCQFDD